MCLPVRDNGLELTQWKAKGGIFGIAFPPFTFQLFGGFQIA